MLYPITVDPCIRAELSVVDLGKIYKKSLVFVKARGWQKIDRPSSIVSSLNTEIGELSELYAWRKSAPRWISGEKIDKTLQELADITIYAIRLAVACGIDVKTILLNGDSDLE